ncbi:MAG: DNA polymerase II large subunit, partial [Candidatus Geothermarchaeales archaeon]
SCPTCGSETSSLRHCATCAVTTQNDRCPSCERNTVPYRHITVDIRTLMANARSLVHASPKLVKGVRGLLSGEKIPERLEKGFLRSLFDISVFKDGTVRFDVTNAPLTAFRPKDVGLSVTEAQELGYDVSSENERVTLKPQDIIVPRVAGDYLLKVSRFVDTLLERLYDLELFYGANTVQDLIGTLIVALSPHTSAGIVGRIVGYTDTQVLYATPLWHAQKRRDCDGDQDSIMLLMDVLLNFSPYFLPASMGGTMDAPLMITPILLAAEVDSQAHNLELSSRYPLEFYEAAQSGTPASEAAKYVKWVYDTLNTPNQYGLIPSGFEGALLQLPTNKSSYGKLRTMAEKVKFQVALSNKLSSVDVKTVVKAVLQNHLLPDLVGNLRAFTTQSFRCKRCNARYRRPSLSGRCDICGGALTQTVHAKTVTKYLGIVRGLVDDYVEDPYIKERLKLLERELRLTLAHGPEAQKTLSEYL